MDVLVSTLTALTAALMFGVAVLAHRYVSLQREVSRLAEEVRKASPYRRPTLGERQRLQALRDMDGFSRFRSVTEQHAVRLALLEAGARPSPISDRGVTPAPDALRGAPDSEVRLYPYPPQVGGDRAADLRRKDS